VQRVLLVSRPCLFSATFQWVRGELIAKGSYGRVYLALNVSNGELMAVKQVETPHTASDRADSRQTEVVEALKFESSQFW
jgi:serine/threonine protein kinase